MNSNIIEEWKVFFELKGYITFTEKVNIQGVEITNTADKVIATIRIQALNNEEAQNLATEKIDGILAAMSSVLKQKITAEIKEIKGIEQDGVTREVTSYIAMDCFAILAKPFPYDKINYIEMIYKL